ncbi:hypothetical protein J7I94_02105 [Streptomyces sp. ISL-12]|uniref:DUF6238 family protein n=1 Tax=Streptomyces sp. ISL-12 TaxID=2819177 RepID=UPI001BE6EBFB|nr:hypothetical protein [Streptomyces sp. ISL-12]
MFPPPPPGDAHPYLRAATAGVRHHTRGLHHASQPEPVDRNHLDVLHAHLTEVHHFIAQCSEATRPPLPAAGRHLAEAHARLWLAMAAIHSAFHLLPTASGEVTECRPGRLLEQPPVLTICQRHLAAGRAVRRKTTPTDLNRPHVTTCTR